MNDIVLLWFNIALALLWEERMAAVKIFNLIRRSEEIKKEIHKGGNGVEKKHGRILNKK